MREIVSPLSGPFTTFGQAPIDFYKVGAYRPELAYSFYNEYYRKGRQPVNFLQAIDHSATSNATMTGDYGPELVTNGSFDTDTGWTKGTGWTISNGVASCDGTNGVTILQTYSGGLTENAAYEFSFTVSNYVSGNIRPYIGGNNSDLISINSNGNYKFISEAGSSNDYVGFQSSATNFSIDNISVREIPKIQWRPHNLLTYSEDFASSDWTKTATTITSNAAMAPDGTLTADKISHTSTNAAISQSANTVSGVEYDGGIFAKYIDHQWLRVQKNVGVDAWFDLQNGVLGTDSTSGATITSLAGGWYYLEVPSDATGASSSIALYLANADGSTTETSGTSAYIWGAHLYRSDLGGMADVPADARVISSATKYVRTAGREVTGTELVTNGTFDTDSDWAKGTGWTIGSGVASCDGTQVATSYLEDANLTAVVGQNYRVQFTLNNRTAGNININFGGDSTSTVFTDGTYTYYMTAVSTATFKMTANSSFVGDIDNISVKEIDVDPSAARYLPRRGHHVYNGSQWVNEGLLHESEARTNLITNSMDLSTWSLVGSPVITDNGDGSFTVEDDNAAAYEAIHTSTSITSGTTSYTYAVDIKKTTGGTSKTVAINFQLTGGTTVSSNARLNTDTGTLTNITAATIEDVGDYWRISGSATDNSSGNTSCNLYLYPATADHGGSTDNQTIVGSATFRYPQLELGSTPSSYIPTSGSQVTRAAETLTIPAANLPWPSPVYTTNEELVTNGDGSDTTGWTEGNSGVLTSVSGEFDLENSVSGYGYAYQGVSTTAGNVYEVSWTYNAEDSTDDGFIRVGTTTGGGEVYAKTLTSSGTYTHIFKATQSTTYIRFGNANNVLGEETRWDNISVREINPLAVSIQMDGRMTYADTGASLAVVPFQHQYDTNNFLKAQIRLEGADTGTFRVWQAANGYGDAEEVTNAYSPGINVPFNVAGRFASNDLEGAADGIVTAANTTPDALPDLSSTDLKLGFDFMGTIGTFRVWAEDIGNTGIAEATEPSEEATLFLSFDGTETSYIDFEWSV